MIELGRSEDVILEMDRLANEDLTHIATEEELDVYRGNWWIRSNFVGSDTMPASRKRRIKHTTKIGRKAPPPRGGNGKLPGGIPHLRHHRDGLNTG